jgi:nucleotide-binding universal stress UspA family protein
LGQKIEGHDSTKEQKLGSTIESFKTHNPISLPSFERILVAYDGMHMSKRALSYAAYISKISDSEVVVVNVIDSHRDLNNVLPVTIKANLEGKAEQTDIARDYRRVPLDEVLREVIEEMTTVCKAAGMTGNITYEIRAGDPADEIIKVSNLMDLDLIVMGSRRIASILEGIGSTTRKVATKVKIPLLIVQKQARYKDEW